METNFKFLAATVKKDVEYSLIVAAAHDEPVIAAIKDATKYLKLNLFLIGDSAAIEDLLKKYQLTGKIINELDLVLISEQAVKLTKELPNPIIMKGIVDTKYVLKAVVNSATGIKNSKVLSHVGLMHFPEFNKTFLISDGGMNIAPGIDEKWEITKNAVKVAQQIGIKVPKVGLVSAVEKVNPKIVSTTDAEALVNRWQAEKINDFILAGPLAIDNLVSLEAAKHKGIAGPVAGNADILIFPELVSGNVFYKTSTFLSHIYSAAVVVGAKCPIIVTSRADNAQTKLNSIMLGTILVCN